MSVFMSSNALPLLLRNLLSNPSAADLEKQLRELLEAVYANGLSPEVLRTVQPLVHAAAKETASSIRVTITSFATLASDASLRYVLLDSTWSQPSANVP